MANETSGPTITPSFREFLPVWVARQEWFGGTGVPGLTMVGAFRLEDPAGEVGMETHLLADGETVYQVPMTYRGAPLPGAAATALITEAEHSVLGTRWIYDAECDPVWRREMVRLVKDRGTLSMRGPDGVVPGAVTTRALRPERLAVGGDLSLSVYRVLTAGQPAELPGERVAGVVSIASPQVTARLVLVGSSSTT